MKIRIISSALITLFLASSGNAQKLIYCPEQVECSKDADINSCKIIGGTQGYWSEKMRVNGKIRKGTYKIEQISGTYQSPDHNYATCFYYYRDSVFSINILLDVKPDFSIESFIDETTKWRVNGYDSVCSIYKTNQEEITTYNCPFTNK